MPTNDDMTTPLTRRDLDEVLDQRLAKYPTRDELDERLTKLRTDLRAEFAADRAALRTEIAADTRATNEKLRAEIAADTRALNEVLLEDAFKRFRVIDDQYKDLPTRVAKLERKVFPPPRRKRAG
jgi:hypothetical protein